MEKLDIVEDRYVELAAQTDIPDYRVVAKRLQGGEGETFDDTTLRLLHAVMGMVTEAGELMDAMKRHLIYGKPIDLVNLKEECGDSFWYQALLARAAGFTFEEVQERNIEKLAALNRDLEAERKVLEK